MSGFTSILIYAVISLTCCSAAKRCYVRSVDRLTGQSDSARKMPYSLIFSIAALFALYNAYCTGGKLPTGGDRLNYYLDFSGFRKNESVALQLIFNVVKYCGGDIFTVYYFTTFVCVFLTFVAYRKMPRADYCAVALLLLTDFVFFTFTALKQCYACACAAMFFAYAIDENTPKNVVLSITYLTAACLFHTSGFILIRCTS